MVVKRADKRKNIDKIAKAYIKNPLATDAKIAEEAGVSQRTVERRKDEVAEVVGKDEKVVSMTDKDWEIQEAIQAIKFNKIKNNPNNISDSDLNNWDKQSTARYSMFKGDITDKDGGLKATEEEKQQVKDALKANGFDV